MAEVVYTLAQEAEWTEFKARFSKSYVSLEEEASRRAAYHARVERIAALNAKNGKAVFGVTSHADRPDGHKAYASVKIKGARPLPFEANRPPLPRRSLDARRG